MVDNYIFRKLKSPTKKTTKKPCYENNLNHVFAVSIFYLALLLLMFALLILQVLCSYQTFHETRDIRFVHYFFCLCNNYVTRKFIIKKIVKYFFSMSWYFSDVTCFLNHYLTTNIRNFILNFNFLLRTSVVANP